MRELYLIILMATLFLSQISVKAQTYNHRKLTDETELWFESLSDAAANGQPYYSQFDQYPVRIQDSLTSSYTHKLGVELYVYGVDFYYASGTWFSPEYKERCRKNLISVVKNAWRRNRAIPCFSWHLENPYVPSDFENYMGCRYRYGVNGYPVEHRYVIKEILENKGNICGFGSYCGKENTVVYKNPAEWFDARCKEIADIIREFKDDEGNAIPIILRLWHECEDDWQWWGKKFVTAEDYKSFFQLTVLKLEQYTDSNNILYAYGPDRYWNSEKEYMLRYPGDDYVDLIGFDDYSIGTGLENLEDTINRAIIVSKIANKHKKVAALFETANSKDETSSRFFCDYLQPLIQTEGVDFGLIQLWSTDKLNTADEISDRFKFLTSNLVKVVNK